MYFSWNPAESGRLARRPRHTQAGYYDVGIGAGVETMTLDPMKFDDKMPINPAARNPLSTPI